MVAPARLCLICKGRNLCGHSSCPLLGRLKIKSKIEENLSENFFGPSHSVFIGRRGYPYVNAGTLSGIENIQTLIDPKNWLKMGYSELIQLYSGVIRSKQKENIFSSSKFVQELQEVALANHAPDVEIVFKRKPLYRMSFSDIMHPMGPSGEIKKFRLAENPKVPYVVEKIVCDELKANEMAFMLYSKGIDVYKISAIFSSGVLGRDKKLVPTRWSITGVDDIIFREMIKTVRAFPEIEDYQVYWNESLNNHFEILLIPGTWEFENFEAWAPGSFWSFNLKKTEILREYEPFQGRKDYAELQGGGYYASRFAVAEGLFSIRKQAKVIVFREVYEGYVIPLGVWQVRENVRKAFQKPPEHFQTLSDALERISSRLRIPIEEYKKQSVILSQRRLNEFC